MEDYKCVLKLEPNNKEAKQNCDLLQSSIASDMEQPALSPAGPA